jgi:hypothetical protein
VKGAGQLAGRVEAEETDHAVDVDEQDWLHGFTVTSCAPAVAR